MRFIICSDGVKREIHGSFSICGTRQDFDTLVHFLVENLREGFSYGWVDIHSRIVKEGALNEVPLSWYEEAISDQPPGRIVHTGYQASVLEHPDKRRTV